MQDANVSPGDGRGQGNMGNGFQDNRADGFGKAWKAYGHIRYLDNLLGRRVKAGLGCRTSGHHTGEVTTGLHRAFRTLFTATAWFCKKAYLSIFTP